jgi:multidrug efflux system membrane fusion protein
VSHNGVDSTQTGVPRTNLKRFRQTRTFFLMVLVVWCGLWVGCSSADKPSTARAGGPPQAMPVGVATAKKMDMPVYLTGLGSVQAFNTVSVKSRVDGQLVQVAFKEGQHVNKGDLLAVVDPRPFEVALSQAQAQLFKDQASLRDAQLNYERFKGLLQDSGAMSQQQVDTQRATADQLEGAVKSDQAAIDTAKLNLSYCHITSPIAGRIGLRLVDLGNMVHASDTNAMLVITQLQPIAVVFTLPEDDLLSVKTHMTGKSLEVDAYSRDDRSKIESGTLLTIDNQIDQSTGTGKLKAVFENKGETLWPNQFVNVHLLLQVMKNVIVIPAAAIQRGPQGTFVYAVKPDKNVEIRPVSVALTQGNTAAVASGIASGDMVVTDGQDKLQAGITKVEPRTGGGSHNSGNGVSNPQEGQNHTSGAQ